MVPDFNYEAEARYDPNADEWIVRLHRWAADNTRQNGTEYLGLCAANGQDEAELIAASINRSLAYGLGDQMDDVRAMFNELPGEVKHGTRKTADYDWPTHPELGAAWTYEPDGKDNHNG